MMEAPEQDAPEPSPGADDQPHAEPFLVNKEAFPNVKVGDEIMARVVAIHDSEIECEPMDKPEEEQPEPDAGPEPAPAGEPSLME